MPLDLPMDEGGALVLQNLSALDGREQAALLRWLDAPDRKQVVSTIAQPLFPLVARGLFDEALYFRLNVMLISVDSSGAPVRAKAGARDDAPVPNGTDS